MLHDLDDRRRMNDHEVDALATGRETTGTVSCTRLGKGASRGEATLGNRDDAHTIEVFDFVGHVCFAVDDSALDVALQAILATRRDEQNTTFRRNLVVVHRRFSGRDQVLDVRGADRDVAGATVDTVRGRVLRKSVIRFQ